MWFWYQRNKRKKDRKSKREREKNRMKKKASSSVDNPAEAFTSETTIFPWNCWTSFWAVCQCNSFFFSLHFAYKNRASISVWAKYSLNSRKKANCVWRKAHHQNFGHKCEYLAIYILKKNISAHKNRLMYVCGCVCVCVRVQWIYT